MSRWPVPGLPFSHTIVPTVSTDVKATLNLNFDHLREPRSCVKDEVAVKGLPVPNSP